MLIHNNVLVALVTVSVQMNVKSVHDSNKFTLLALLCMCGAGTV